MRTTLTFRHLDIVLLLVIILTALLAGCVGRGINAENHRTLAVMGVGEAKWVPNMDTIQLGVSIVDENIDEAIDEANSSMHRVTDEMTSRGILEEDIQTTNYNIWRQDIHHPETGMPTGESTYHVDATMVITVRDIIDIGGTIDAGLASGATDFVGKGFEISDPSLLEAEARSNALTGTKYRALEIAIGLDVNLGEVLSISESVIGIPGPVFSYGLKGDVASMRGGGAQAPINPGQTTIVSQIDVVYEILQY